MLVVSVFAPQSAAKVDFPWRWWRWQNCSHAWPCIIVHTVVSIPLLPMSSDPSCHYSKKSKSDWGLSGMREPWLLSCIHAFLLFFKGREEKKGELLIWMWSMRGQFYARVSFFEDENGRFFFLFFFWGAQWGLWMRPFVIDICSLCLLFVIVQSQQSCT